MRSPHAFATIDRVDVAAAETAPGVAAVFTAADLAAAHYHSISHGHPVPGGKTPMSPHRAVLAGKRAMHVGEPVAMVVASSAAAALDAAEKVMVDYEPLTPVTDARAALKTGAPQLWPEAPGNVGFEWAAPPDPDGKKQVGARQGLRRGRARRAP